MIESFIHGLALPFALILIVAIAGVALKSISTCIWKGQF
jgi:hypothetical protein